MGVKHLLILSLLLHFGASIAAAQIPAFPGAEGYGGYAAGGRGGDVYTVTNLNTSGAGSFAEAIATVPSAGRTIVFAVSGHIHINKTTLSKSKVTIAGQTAPGDGIGFRDGTFIISGDDIVIRHARYRYGKQAAGGDCIDISSGTSNAILDSVSIQFSTDENISSFNSPPENITMQWALNGWGLESHSAGGLWDQNHATAHHTLWAHNHTRNPKARPGGLLEWINNVTFDWDIGFIMGDSETPASWKANVIGSYFLCPASNIRNRALEKANLDRNGSPNFSLYLNNCRHDSNGNGVVDGTDKGYGIASGNYITLASPVANTGSVPVTIDDPTVAFKKVVSKAGPLRLDVSYSGAIRDEVDARMISNLVTQTANHISNQTSLGLSNNGYGTLNSAPAPVDTDKDGMPDFYETALGWNPAAQDHNTTISGVTFMPAGTPAGYTRLEEYLHFMAIPHGTVAKNISGSPTSISVDMAKFTSGFPVSPSYAVSNTTGGTVSKNGAIATFTPTLNYTGRGRFDFTVTDSAGHSWTQTCALVVTNTALPRDLAWMGVGAVWDQSSLNWLRPSNSSTVAFSSGDRVTFDQSGVGQNSVSISGALSPATVVVNAGGNYTFDGSGSLNSTGTLTKRGSGDLTISAPLTFAGGMDLELGHISFTSPGSLAGGALTMLDGTTLTNGYPSTNTLSQSAGIHIPAGNLARVNTGARFSLSGSLTGDGDFDYNVQTPFSRVDMKGATSAFAGDLNFTGSGGVRLFFNGGSFNGFDNAHVNVDDTVSLQPQTNSGGNTCNIGALSGSGTLSGGTAGAVGYVIGGSNMRTTFSGDITGNATLTKTGSGVLTLSGSNNYTGTTTVASGSLAVNGSITSALTVQNGAKLYGNGTLNGAVTTQSGAQISPGMASGFVGDLTAASGLNATSTTFSMQLSQSPSGANDKIMITGGSGLVSGTNTFSITFPDGAPAAGNYRLIECAAGIPLSVSGGMIMNLDTDIPSGGRQALSLNRTSSGTAGGYIQLVVTGNPATLAWQGTTSGVWDKVTTGNWTGASPATFFSYDSVSFGDSAATRVVTVSGVVGARDMTVDTNLGYSFTNGVSATGKLVKNGSGNLTFTTGDNDFAGGVMLKGGSMLLGSDEASISGDPLTLNAGTFSMFDLNTSYSRNDNDFMVPVGATARINADSRVDMNGSLSGGGTLDFYVPWVRTTLFGDWSDFAGTVNVISDSSGGDFRVGESYLPDGYEKATMNLGANVYFYFAGISNAGEGTTIEVGELKGVSNSHLRGGVTGGRSFTYRIGGKTQSGAEAIFAGDIAEQNSDTTTTYVKTGAGIWRLAGSGSWNGSTIVESGTLRIWPSGATPYSCVGTTRVSSGAVLDLGTGTFASEAINVEPGASLLVQNNFTIIGDINNDGIATIHTGELTVNGDIVNNGTLRMHGLSTLSATGEFTNNGVLDLLTSNARLPANFTNNGTVILNSERQILTASINGADFRVSIFGYAGHSYRLQISETLNGGWMNVGNLRNGANAELTFTDFGGASIGSRFYRLNVGP
jgi:autotransporter-associated beta strand protein